MAAREETVRHISVIQMLLDSEKRNAELQQTINELQRRPTVESHQVLQQQNKELQQTVNELQSRPTVESQQQFASFQKDRQEDPLLRSLQDEISKQPPSPLSPPPAFSPLSTLETPQSTPNEDLLRMKARLNQPRPASTAVVDAEIARLVEVTRTNVGSSQPRNHNNRPRIEVDLTVDDSNPLSETGLDGGGLSGHDAGLDERDDGGSVGLRDRQSHPNRKRRRFNNEESMPSVLLDTEDTAPASQATNDSTARRGIRTKPTVAKAAPRPIGKSRKGPRKCTDEIPVPEHFLFVPNDGGDDDDDDETTGVLRPASELPAADLSSIQNAYKGLLNTRAKQVDPRTMMSEKHRGTYVGQGVCIARYLTQGSRAKACPSSVACSNT